MSMLGPTSGLHALAQFAMERTATQEGIEFDLLQTSWCTEAFLVARRSVTGSGLALPLGFSAFEYDDVAWHEMWMLH